MALQPGGIVAVDFDGVVNSYQTRGPKLVDPPEPGALEFINWLIENGVEPVIFTTRARSTLGSYDVARWLKNWGFPPMRITAEKFAALAYVDDRACVYTPRSADWDSVKERILDLTELNDRRGIPDVPMTSELTDTNA